MSGRKRRKRGLARATTPGPQGTGFLLRIRPYIEGDTIGKSWNWNAGISNAGSIRALRAVLQLAVGDDRSEGILLPDPAENGFAPGDMPMMLSIAWSGGGTDYGGCAGTPCGIYAQDGLQPLRRHDALRAGLPPGIGNTKSKVTTPERRWGIFGRVNESTKFSEIRDGTVEHDHDRRASADHRHDAHEQGGWAIGGPATLFTTGAMFRPQRHDAAACSRPSDGALMNNGFFGSPGSDHPGGANFGLADGSVRFISSSIDPNVFALLGSMADSQPVNLD